MHTQICHILTIYVCLCRTCIICIRKSAILHMQIYGFACTTHVPYVHVTTCTYVYICVHVYTCTYIHILNKHQVYGNYNCTCLYVCACTFKNNTEIDTQPYNVTRVHVKIHPPCTTSDIGVHYILSKYPCASRCKMHVLPKM